MSSTGTLDDMANFGNWVRLRIVAMFAVVATASLLMALLSTNTMVKVISAAVAIFTLGMTGFLLYLYLQFSSRVGRIQNRLWQLTIDRLAWDGHGSALDIGTGNGALAVRLALRHPSADVTGVDIWGHGWEYSQRMCEANASHCKVAPRCTFRKASAAALPFPDGSFDAVISHFVFHEVSSTADKCEVVAEALRVLKPGGTFSFHDMFFNREFYGPEGNLEKQLEKLPLQDMELLRTQDILQFPALMNHRRVLGCAGILSGRKS